jgi:lipoyl(octanoyl) transferase
VAYVMLDLNRRRPDLRAYVAALEAWLIATLDASSPVGAPRRRPGPPGARPAP